MPVVTAFVTLITTLSFARALSKFVPVIEIAVPAVPMLGAKDVIVGVPLAVPIVKVAALVGVPAGAVTLIGPVVAPVGTVAVIWVVVAVRTVAVVPLNLTVSWDDVALNPVPLIVTVRPEAPVFGVKLM